MEIQAKKLYTCWKKLNLEFLRLPDETGMLIPTRDFTRVTRYVRLRATNGFGLPRLEDLPPFFSSYERRANLLRKRYVDEQLWHEGVDRLKLKSKRMARTNPLSFVVAFHRRATSERGVPAGGGCLQTITFVWCDGVWSLHVYLRASEITARLLADLVFVNEAVNQIVEEVPIKKWDPKNAEIVWDLALASQMKYMIPIFLLYLKGEDFVVNYFSKEEQPDDSNWVKTVRSHFWDTVIWPDRISWAQRRKWSEKFLEGTNTDWAALHQELGYQHKEKRKKNHENLY